MKITEFSNGFTFQELSYFKRVYIHMKRIVAMFLLLSVLLCIVVGIEAAIIVALIVLSVNAIEGCILYRYHLRAIQFTSTAVDLEYFFLNKLCKVNCSYKDMSITMKEVWYKGSVPEYYLRFMCNDSFSFNQYSIEDFNHQFMRILLTRYHAYKYQ